MGMKEKEVSSQYSIEGVYNAGATLFVGNNARIVIFAGEAETQSNRVVSRSRRVTLAV
jgi:hypothetical protein